MKIVITQEDVKNSGDFELPGKCALAMVMKKTLNDNNISVGHYTVNNDKGRLGEIYPPFTKTDYDNLTLGGNKEFVTEYTPNEKLQEN